MVDEARLEEGESGLRPATDGWFVVNVADAAWGTSGGYGSGCVFESEAAPFRHVAVNVRVLAPGQPNGMYHRENSQEDFLVLHGECVLLVEEQERRLKAWDFVHCPAETTHIFVGAGDGPCAILMVGERVEREVFCYPRSELARRHGAGVATETSQPREAYAGTSPIERRRPADWDALPWA
jgi:uncharacterized cupin superfamily protein